MVERLKRYALPAFVFILLLLLITSECERRSEKRRVANNLEAALDSIMYFKNRLGTETASVKTMRLDKQDLRELVLKKDRQLQMLTTEFASIKSVTKFKTVTKLDTLYLPFKEYVPHSFTRNDSVNTKFYSFGYRVDSAGLQIRDFKIPNQTTIITGYKRTWLLGKQTITTDITHSNPYIKTENILSVEAVVPEPWYKKWYLWLAAGVVAGAIVK
ncbi:MAG: DUF6549 family protein [Flavobacterium sp.]